MDWSKKLEMIEKALQRLQEEVRLLAIRIDHVERNRFEDGVPKIKHCIVCGGKDKRKCDCREMHRKRHHRIEEVEDNEEE